MMMLEKMDAFFEARLEGYDSHMLTDIEGAADFYPFTAKCLPEHSDCRILDLGCGTGLELAYFFERNPDARVTGIDLSGGMLDALRRKFPDKQLELIQGSYFDIPFGNACFDAAVSVESLHHFPKEKKTGLYCRLRESLKDGGYFILTDYFAHEQAFEDFCFRELKRLKEAQGIADDAFYHYDTPLTLEHELEALNDGGFSRVTVLKNWGATYVLKAEK
jgi:tRNA (cmo5U34)-methyltransferase